MIKNTTIPKQEPGETVYDYSAITSLEEFKTLADEATVIFAANKATGDRSIVFGKEVIQAIAFKVIPPQSIQVLIFAVDYSTTEPEHLCAAVQVTKGFHEADVE